MQVDEDQSDENINIVEQNVVRDSTKESQYKEMVKQGEVKAKASEDGNYQFNQDLNQSDHLGPENEGGEERSRTQ